LDKIQAEFEKHSGNTYVMMGHVEDGRFVASDPTGQIKLVDISLREIQKAAVESGCTLVCLGCHSASANVQVGVTQEFNPIDAVALLSKAVLATTTYDFYKTLTAPERNITLLLDKSVATDSDGIQKATLVSFEMRFGSKLLASGFVVTPGLVRAPTPQATPITAVMQ
jgi:hypothetical protein